MRYEIDISCRQCGESCAVVPVSVVNGVPMIVRSSCACGPQTHDLRVVVGGTAYTAESGVCRLSLAVREAPVAA